VVASIGVIENMIAAGIDCGSKTTKVIILIDGKIKGKGKALTGFDQVIAIREALLAACSSAGITEKDLDRIGGTGSGKDSINGAVIVNDIKAICKAAIYLFTEARTVADAGAEEVRAATLDEKGNAIDFAINEKCAAGAGGFIEAMGRALEIPIEQMGPLALQSDSEIAINAQCVIFAESEVVGLIHDRTDKKDISKAIHDAVADHIVTMIRRVGVNEDVVMMGGIALNTAVVEAVKRQLNIDVVLIPDGPEFGAALGAAIVAAGDTEVEKVRK
jgi:benzoyl-CoA reductase subunit D